MNRKPEWARALSPKQLDEVTEKLQRHLRARVLEQMAKEVAELNTAKGWRDEQRSFGDMIALLHSEVSEALEAYRRWGLQDTTDQDGWVETGEFDDVGHPVFVPSPAKPEGVGSEFADVLIRLLDTCELFGVNLSAEYDRKMNFNWNREHRHGGRTL